MNIQSQSQKESRGFAYGLLGVLIFSLTLPATRMAVLEFDPVFVGLGRAIVAAGLSLILLVATRQTIPPLKFLPNFSIVVVGVVIGFPLLSAIAMREPLRMERSSPGYYPSRRLCVEYGGQESVHPCYSGSSQALEAYW
jgi:hypothetical protein